MQNSLFRRRLAIRACFDILLEHKIVPTSVPITSNDVTTPLLTSRQFVLIDVSFFLLLLFLK